MSFRIADLCVQKRPVERSRTGLQRAPCCAYCCSGNERLAVFGGGHGLINHAQDENSRISLKGRLTVGKHAGKQCQEKEGYLVHRTKFWSCYCMTPYSDDGLISPQCFFVSVSRTEWELLKLSYYSGECNPILFPSESRKMAKKPTSSACGVLGTKTFPPFGSTRSRITCRLVPPFK